MTREEAIKILNEIIDEGWLISDFDKCMAIDACEMAIKALKEEPVYFPLCADCKQKMNEIRNPHSINAIRRSYNMDEIRKPYDKMKKVKELVLTPNWIPTSERQPKENGNYLAFYCTNDGTAKMEFMMVDHCNAGGGWLHEKNGRKEYKKVIAWMPLPEPYKEKRGVINDKRTY